MPAKKTIMLDVGGKLEPGFLDHHHAVGSVKIGALEFNSTTSIAARMESYYIHIAEKIDARDDGTRYIVTHENPDFDSISAAYIVSRRLETGTLPENAAVLAAYADLVDSGKKKINAQDPVRLFSLFYAFEITAMEAMETARPEANEHFFNKILQRGFASISLILNRFLLLSEEEKKVGLDHPVLFKGKEFEKERAIIADDFAIYSQEKADPCQCKMIKLRLPYKPGYGEGTDLVDGLIWMHPPKCRLHKYWARSDKTSPDGNGYPFTIIPLVENLATGLSRTVLSVDPDSPYTLGFLGRELEYFETETEEMTPGLKAGEKRSRNSRRFNEEWCHNDDPWFDGRSFGYTIVDSPRTLSLMSINKVIEIALRYFEPKIKAATIDNIIPFSYRRKKKTRGAAPILDGEHSSLIVKSHGHSFLSPYVRDLFRNARENGSRLSPDVLARVPTVAGGDSESPLIESYDFGFGIGFIIVSYRMKGHDTTSFLDSLRAIRNAELSLPEMLTTSLEQEYREPFLLEPRMFSEVVLQEKATDKLMDVIASRVLARRRWVDESIEGFEISRRSVIADAVFWHNLDGDAVIVSPDAPYHSSAFANSRLLHLFSLHQRYALKELSQRLEDASWAGDLAGLQKTKEIIDEFSVNGCLETITNDRDGEVLFSALSNSLRLESLYRQVSRKADHGIQKEKDARFRGVQILASVGFIAVTLNIAFQNQIIKLVPLLDLSSKGPVVSSFVSYTVFATTIGIATIPWIYHRCRILVRKRRRVGT